MNITRAQLDRRGRIIGNENVDKVSEAKVYDTIFISPDERNEDVIEKVNVILETQGLEVVDSFKETSAGNLRSFIGERGYAGSQTAMM